MTQTEVPSPAVPAGQAGPMAADSPSTDLRPADSPVLVHIFGAQMAGLLGVVLWVLALWLLYQAIGALMYAPLVGGVIRAITTPLSFLFGVLLALGPGAALGLGQWLVLRRWINRPRRVWIGLSAAALAILVIGGAILFAQAYRPPFSDLSSLTPQQLQALAGPLRWLGWPLGAVVGIPCGLVFGLLQSLLLTAGRRRWWLSSTLLWVLFGLVGSIILVEGAITILYFELRPPVF